MTTQTKLPLVTSLAVKQRTVDVAIQLMARAGIDVTEEGLGTTTVTLHLQLPPDTSDPHGQRLLAARASVPTDPHA